jgi:hypothetical protein
MPRLENATDRRTEARLSLPQPGIPTGGFTKVRFRSGLISMLFVSEPFWEPTSWTL